LSGTNVAFDLDNTTFFTKRGALTMRTILTAFTVLAILSFSFSFSFAASDVEIPAKGMPTMIDIGAKSCIPCKMMAPIMEELEVEYKGKALIAFIDVREDMDQARKYNIRAIPTQIFYDTQGREQWRHEGFLGKEVIVAKLRELGVKE
jgi:thioredoxin 1